MVIRTGITYVSLSLFACAISASDALALNLPPFFVGGGPSASVQPPPRFNCSQLQNVSQYESYKLNIEDVSYCIEQGFDPPRHWSRSGGDVYRGEGTSTSLSSKCMPRNRYAECKGFNTQGSTPGGTPSVPPPPPGSNNPNLQIPPFRVPTTGRVSLPCGGSAPLDIGRLISQGGSFINNVRFGNVSGVVNTGMQIANSLFGGGCNGGIMNMIQGAINMVMPAGCNVNVTNGFAAACSGSVLSLPGAVSMQISSGGSLTFPNGATFMVNGNPIALGNNITINVTANGSGLRVTTSDGQTFDIADITELTVNTAAVLIPDGTQIPLDAAQNILPTTLPPP